MSDNAAESWGWASDSWDVANGSFPSREAAIADATRARVWGGPVIIGRCSKPPHSLFAELAIRDMVSGPFRFRLGVQDEATRALIEWSEKYLENHTEAWFLETRERIELEPVKQKRASKKKGHVR